MIARKEEDDANENEQRGFRMKAQRFHDSFVARVEPMHMELQLKNGPARVPVASLEGLFQLFVSDCQCFRTLMSKTLSKHGHVLTLVLYYDEVTPGNPLHPDNKRKTHLFYVTLQEFGKATRNVQAWLPATMVKHDTTDQMDCQFSQFLRNVLRMWKNSPLFSSGVSLDFGSGRTEVLRLRRRIRMLPDYAASCSAWNSKTASGLRPCLWCQNLLMKSSNLPNQDEYLVNLLEADPSKFDVMDAACIHAIADELENLAATASKPALESFEKHAGFKFHPESLLQDRTLREFVSPQDTATDGMHVLYASGGIVAVEIGLILDALKEHHVNLNDIRDLCKSDWHHAAHLDGSIMAKCLDVHKVTPQLYKGSASETLSLVPVLHWMVNNIKESLPNELGPKIASFEALCELSKEYQILKHSSLRQTTAELQSACEKHMVLFMDAYGYEFGKPKHHLSFHLAQMYDSSAEDDKDKLFFDCWACERKNKDWKYMVDSGQLKRLGCLEQSSLGRLLSTQVDKMKRAPDLFQDRLLGRCMQCPELQEALNCNEVWLAKAMVLGCEQVGLDDILLLPADCL